MTEILLGSNPTKPTVVGIASNGGIGADSPDVEKARQLPDPSGYHILCAVPEVDDTYESGIIKADTTKHHEDCYKDEKRFPSGPWCKVGDFILIRPHTGSRLDIHGKEFRLINDDSVEGTVQDPRGIKRK